MYGLTRKDGNNRTRMGITSYAIAFVLVLGVTYYLSSKAAKTPAVVLTNSKAEVNVKRTSQSINRWDKIAVDTALTEQNQSVRRKLKDATQAETPKPAQAVLDVQGVAVTELQTSDMMEYRPQLADQSQGLEALLGQTKFGEAQYTVEKADEGRSYVRTRSGVFTASVEPGTKLVAADGTTMVIGDDNLLYKETAKGERTKMVKLPEGIIKDVSQRFYRFDTKSQSLQLATPGGPGNFKGPDGNTYTVTREGKLVRGTEKDATLEGRGEFTGTDNQIYVLANGLLLGKTTQPVSFGQSVITGVGHFRDPSGQLLLRGEDGSIYGYGADQALKKANIAGTGSFSGPDGGLYRRDELGTIIRLVAVAQPNGGQTQPSQNRATAAQVQTVGLSGTSQYNTNAMQFQRGAKGSEFVPESVAGDLKGATVYKNDEPKPEVKREETPEEAALKPKTFLPIGQNIPFFTTSKVTTQFDNPGIVEAQVAENVFFHDAVLPAGTKIYGRFGTVGRNNRITLNFTTLVYPDGKELPIAGEVFDVSKNFGLEAYLKPVPAWVKVMRFAQIPVLQNISRAANMQGGSVSSTPNVSTVTETTRNTPDGTVKTTQTTGPSSGSGTQYNMGQSQTGAANYAVELLRKTQDEIETENDKYFVLPAGTPGIIKLTNRLDLKPAERASQSPAAPAATLAGNMAGNPASTVTSMVTTPGEGAGNSLSAMGQAVKQAVNSAASASMGVNPTPGITQAVQDTSTVNAIFGKKP